MTNAPADDVPIASVVPETGGDLAVPAAVQAPGEPPGHHPPTPSSSWVPPVATSSSTPNVNSREAQLDAFERQRRLGPQPMAALGGSVASAILGLWTLVTLWMSPWVLILSLLGVLLGLWGLGSTNRRLASVGIFFNTATVIMILLRIST